MSSDAVREARAAMADPTGVVLEGFHAVKHAVRFGAQLRVLVTADPEGIAALSASLAPDVADALAQAGVITVAELGSLVRRPPRTAIVGVANRPVHTAGSMLSRAPAQPVVVLEDPRRLGNLGACVRVAAGAGAGGLLTTGPADPWHPEAIRGGAGLQFALPVARAGAPDSSPAEVAALLAQVARTAGRPLLALDLEGDELQPSDLTADAVLIFGTERDGISDELLAASDRRLRLPMQSGVSSLNLATSVAATLYAWRLTQPRG